MKRTLFVVLCIFAFWNAGAQKQSFSDVVTGNNAVNIALNEVNKRFVPPLNQVKSLKSGQVSNGSIIINYVNFPEEAKPAFEYAVNIWKGFVASDIPIHICAKWESLSNNVLASSNPAYFYKNFNGAEVENVYYPISLVEKLSGKEWNEKAEADIFCLFNGNMPWYFGTDGNTPTTSYDLTTAALHEIAHGLGFSGFLDANDNKGYFDNINSLPSIYDYYIFNKLNQRLADKNYFQSPSNELFNQLTSQDLIISKTNENTENVSIYAPLSWKEGVSVYHLNHEKLKNANREGLMGAFLKKGEAIHYPGDETLEILGGLGWNNVSFQFTELKDFEEPQNKIPVNIGINSSDLETASVKLIYSTNYFNEKNEAELTFIPGKNNYSGEMLLNGFLGKVQYYFELNLINGKKFTFPANAASKKLSLTIGPDYYGPEINHNPVKVITPNTAIQINAEVSDNIGIKQVLVEYFINGSCAEVMELKSAEGNKFYAEINSENLLDANSTFSYRIIAKDLSKRNNQNILPKSGYYQANVFESVKPVSSYRSDFNSINEDFVLADFQVSEISGFSDGILHTAHPYPKSELEDEKYNLVAQLKYPVVIRENGLFNFDEVVLVEPGEQNAAFENPFFWDYVVVEGSKDGGENWLALTNGYDSGIDELWKKEFTNGFNGRFSTAFGNENMFVSNSINLTDNTGFVAGDTVIFRFRLSSDNTINGWGWAIDNLEIQENTLVEETVFNNEKAEVYPNPFHNEFTINCSEISNDAEVNLVVSDLLGKIVHNESWVNNGFLNTKRINLTGSNPGIYIVQILVNNTQKITKKISKH